MRAAAVWICFFALSLPAEALAQESEVFEKTQTQVAVREHPKTGRSYAVIIGPEGPSRGHVLAGPVKLIQRPDYRMLEPGVKSGEIPYEGPVSDRKKVYAFAGALAAAGVVSGVLAAAAAPAQAGAAAAGGAGIYGAAGTAVTAGTVSGVWLKRRNPSGETENFDFQSSSRELRQSSPGSAEPADPQTQSSSSR